MTLEKYKFNFRSARIPYSIDPEIYNDLSWQPDPERCLAWANTLFNRGTLVASDSEFRKLKSNADKCRSYFGQISSDLFEKLRIKDMRTNHIVADFILSTRQEHQSGEQPLVHISDWRRMFLKCERDIYTFGSEENTGKIVDSGFETNGVPVLPYLHRMIELNGNYPSKLYFIDQYALAGDGTNGLSKLLNGFAKNHPSTLNNISLILICGDPDFKRPYWKSVYGNDKKVEKDLEANCILYTKLLLSQYYYDIPVKIEVRSLSWKSDQFQKNGQQNLCHGRYLFNDVAAMTLDSGLSTFIRHTGTHVAWIDKNDIDSIIISFNSLFEKTVNSAPNVIKEGPLQISWYNPV